MDKEYTYIGKKVTIPYKIEYGLSDGYEDSLDRLHPDITWHHITVGSYSGEIISLGYDKDNNWYFKNNSYGSCSGCDWRQGISDKEGAEEFYKAQETLVELGNNISKVIEYLRKETNTSYEFKEEELKEMIVFIESK